MNGKKIYFVSGIDTDAGKTCATGYIAKMWNDRGKSVVTQKFIQTGCAGLSGDISMHRRIMGMELLPEDVDHTTCPVRFPYPASPDLAARIDGRKIDFAAIEESSRRLLEKYDILLLEGAGGLMVPLEGLYTTLDYIEEHGLPVIMVTNPRLGSVSHTLLSLEACINRGVEVAWLVYNLHGETSPEITADTRQTLKAYIASRLPDCGFIEVPHIESAEE